jgi:hypothetical protein
MLDRAVEKIPYFLSEVHSFGEYRPGENKTQPDATSAVRFAESKPLLKQRDQRSVLRSGEFSVK